MVASVGRLKAASDRTGVSFPQDGWRLAPEDLPEVLELTRSPDAGERQLAVRNLCTCHLQADNPAVGDVLVPMLSDPDARVRREVVHALTDSTPAPRVPIVVSALETLWNDADPGVRKRVRRTLGHYRRTGKLTDTPS